MFEIRSDLVSPILKLKKKDLLLNQIIESIGPCLLERGDQGFPAIVRSIINQQLSKSAAQSIYQRLVSLCGDKGITPKLLYDKSEGDIQSIGLSRSKTHYLKGLAGYVLSGKIDFQALESMDDETVINTLTQIKGVGRWTAEMYLMFSMNRLDVFPIDDVALRHAMAKVYNIPKDGSEEKMIAIADKWKPYRTIACWYLYRYLDLLRANRK